jgi:hypothetical protein
MGERGDTTFCGFGRKNCQEDTTLGSRVRSEGNVTIGVQSSSTRSAQNRDQLCAPVITELYFGF